MLAMETIIIQETDPEISDVLYAVLKQEGFRVYALSESGPDVLELIGRAQPHAIMLDYVLSDKDSACLCSEIKQRYPALPVLALSCNSDISEVYRTVGFDGYIAKPFNLDDLFRILRGFIPES